MNERMRDNRSPHAEDDSPMNANPILIASGRAFWIGMFICGLLGLVFLSIVVQDPGAGKLKYIVLTALFFGGFLLVLYLSGVFNPRPPSSPD